MIRRGLLLLIVSLAVISADPFLTEKTDPAAAGMDAARLARIPARMKEFVEQGTAAGFVTLVARHGHVASLEAVGYQDRENKIPMRTDTLFRIASLTKPITCSGVLTLIDEGRISLLDPVEKYLPEFKDLKLNTCGPGGAGYHCESVAPSRPITIRDLMTHTSGLPSNAPSDEANPPQSLAELVSAVAKLELRPEPGTKWNYSNAGMATLGRIIEVISGQAYDQFLAERIFTPLGMKDTYFFVPAEKQSRVATLYTDDHGTLKRVDRPVTPTGPRIPNPAGGIFSTAADLARFYQMMLNHGTLDGKRILSAAAVELATTVQTGDIEAGWAPGMGFGLGWAVVREPLGTFRYNSIGTYGHGGAYRTYGWVDPAKDMVGVILFQRTNGGGDLADEINSFMALSAAAIEP